MEKNYIFLINLSISDENKHHSFQIIKQDMVISLLAIIQHPTLYIAYETLINILERGT